VTAAGPQAAVIVRSGRLRVGDPIVVGTEHGKVRAGSRGASGVQGVGRGASSPAWRALSALALSTWVVLPVRAGACPAWHLEGRDRQRSGPRPARAGHRPQGPAAGRGHAHGGCGCCCAARRGGLAQRPPSLQGALVAGAAMRPAPSSLLVMCPSCWRCHVPCSFPSSRFHARPFFSCFPCFPLLAWRGAPVPHPCLCPPTGGGG